MNVVLDACPPWPSTRAAGGGTSERGCNHALEAFVTRGAFLAGIGAPVRQVIGRDARIQPWLVGVDAFGWVASHGEAGRAGRDEGGAGAGPMRVDAAWAQTSTPVNWRSWL